MKFGTGFKLTMGLGAIILTLAGTVSFNLVRQGELKQLQDEAYARTKGDVVSQQSRRVGYKLCKVACESVLALTANRST